MRAADGVICSTDWLARALPRRSTRARGRCRNGIDLGATPSRARSATTSASAGPAAPGTPRRRSRGWTRSAAVMRELPDTHFVSVGQPFAARGSSRSSGAPHARDPVHRARGLPGRDDALRHRARAGRQGRLLQGQERPALARGRGARRCPASPIRTSTRRSSTASPASTRRRPPRWARSCASWSPIASCASASAPPPRVRHRAPHRAGRRAGVGRGAARGRVGPAAGAPRELRRSRIARVAAAADALLAPPAAPRRRRPRPPAPTTFRQRAARRPTAPPATAGDDRAAARPAGPTPAGRRSQLAQAEVGVAEQPPGSNDSPRIAQYRQATAGSGVGPWCAYFVSWAARQAGAPLGDQGQGFGARRRRLGLGASAPARRSRPRARSRRSPAT